MSSLIADFKRGCADIKMSPTAVLREAGIHPSLWWKWETGKVSPTLKNFERAQNALAALKERAG